LSLIGVQLTLCVVVLAMLLGSNTMRFRGNIVLVGRLRVRFLCHFSIFLSAADSGRNQKRRE